MNWEERAQGEWRCVDSQGRIVARIDSFRGEYMANYEGSSVGAYVSLETAKAAVERKARPTVSMKPVDMRSLSSDTRW